MEKRKVKRTNVADNSKKCFGEILAEGLISKEKALILSIMQNQAQAVTSRDLMKLTHKERGNITRVLYDLERANKVKVCKNDKCPETGRTVRFYELVQAGKTTIAA